VSIWNENTSVWWGKKQNNHLINFQSLSDVLSSLCSDFIFVQIEFGDCLRETISALCHREDERIITLFIFRPSAICWAPSCPISIPSRLNIVNLCVKWEDEFYGDNERIITLLILRASAMFWDRCCPISSSARNTSMSNCVQWVDPYLTEISRE
jgi:hypothetical protein